MTARIRRALNALAQAANWRCPDCDTFNGETDPACIVCDRGRP